ncbi:MAG TPA: dienelactone hydrolase family protein [Pseudolabrys sp.]|nr:dienelactone hydrolase family protein [Pseudolabrys sp.]
MNQQIIDLYDRFTHGELSRRAFVERLAEIAGSTAAALALLPLLTNDYARAETVAANDPRLDTNTVYYKAAGTEIATYLARPKGEAPCPTVIVVHENRGLNPHIKDIARRLALAGFCAFAVDMLSPLGGTPADEDKARAMIAKLDPKETAHHIASAVTVLGHAPGASGKVGAVGFCWGGGMVNRVAVIEPSLNAAVAYYGVQPPATDVPKIKAALLLHYAGLDERIDAGIPAFEAALKANHKKFEIDVYPGVNHAFNNDTSSRYDKAAAGLAWQRTIAFLKRELAA